MVVFVAILAHLLCSYDVTNSGASCKEATMDHWDVWRINERAGRAMHHLGMLDKRCTIGWTDLLQIPFRNHGSLSYKTMSTSALAGWRRSLRP